MNSQKGFIGLVVLLISIAILSMVVFRTGLFLEKTSDGKEQKSIVERDLEAIESAENVKAILETRGEVQMEALEDLR